MSNLSDDEIKAFLACAEKATAGPWTQMMSFGDWGFPVMAGVCFKPESECVQEPEIIVQDAGVSSCTYKAGNREKIEAARNNTQFIAQSRTLAPQLAREVLRLRRTLQNLQFGHHDGCAYVCDTSLPESMCDCNAWAYKESVREALESSK